MRGPGGRRRLAAVLVALTLAAVACSDDKNDNSASGTDESSLSSEVSVTTTSKPTSTTTAPPADPASQAIAAYQKSWDLTFAATNPPNINYPGLSDVLTGTALDEALTLINRLLRTGGRLEGKVTAHAKPLSAAADKVVLDECAVEVSNEYDASGAVVNADDGSTGTHFTVTVVNEGGNWKVSLFERPDENPCAP